MLNLNKIPWNILFRANPVFLNVFDMEMFYFMTHFSKESILIHHKSVINKDKVLNRDYIS